MIRSLFLSAHILTKHQLPQENNFKYNLRGPCRKQQIIRLHTLAHIRIVELTCGIIIIIIQFLNLNLENQYWLCYVHGSTGLEVDKHTVSTHRTSLDWSHEYITKSEQITPTHSTTS